MKNIKEGQTITCPHCKGKKGKVELLYYWIECYLCLGIGKIKIDEIIEVDEKRGDVKAKFTVNRNNDNSPNLITRTDWLI